jgi:arabinosyltransferase C
LLRSRTLATYLKDDWSHDWGQLQRLTPVDTSARPAAPSVTREQHSGLWSPGHINVAW